MSLLMWAFYRPHDAGGPAPPAPVGVGGPGLAGADGPCGCASGGRPPGRTAPPPCPAGGAAWRRPCSLWPGVAVGGSGLRRRGVGYDHQLCPHPAVCRGCSCCARASCLRAPCGSGTRPSGCGAWHRLCLGHGPCAAARAEWSFSGRRRATLLEPPPVRFSTSCPGVTEVWTMWEERSHAATSLLSCTDWGRAGARRGKRDSEFMRRFWGFGWMPRCGAPPGGPGGSGWRSGRHPSSGAAWSRWEGYPGVWRRGDQEGGAVAPPPGHPGAAGEKTTWSRWARTGWRICWPKWRRKRHEASIFPVYLPGNGHEGGGGRAEPPGGGGLEAGKALVLGRWPPSRRRRSRCATAWTGATPGGWTGGLTAPCWPTRGGGFTARRNTGTCTRPRRAPPLSRPTGSWSTGGSGEKGPPSHQARGREPGGPSSGAGGPAPDGAADGPGGRGCWRGWI